MQRMVFLVLLVVLTMLAGCAGRDPNLTVKGMNEFGRTPGAYTLRVSVYELDADGHPQLATQNDPFLSGFVTRTLAARGYTQKASGPVRYALDVHLLCGNMRTADMGLLREELSLPPAAVGAGYSDQLHYWLPDGGQTEGGNAMQDTHDTVQRTRVASGSTHPNMKAIGSASLGGTPQEFCQGRVLVVVTPSPASSATGPAREVFVTRAATEDCRTASGCPVDVCRPALEHALVDLLERRF